jgi:hypothetical protein
LYCILWLIVECLVFKFLQSFWFHRMLITLFWLPFSFQSTRMVNGCARQSICLWIKGHKAVCSIGCFMGWHPIQFVNSNQNKFYGLLKLCKRYFENKIFCHKSLFSSKNICQFFKKTIAKICGNCLQYERVLKIPTFIFWMSPNLVKYAYEWSPFEKHPKIGGGQKKHLATTFNLLSIIWNFAYAANKRHTELQWDGRK